MTREVEIVEVGPRDGKVITMQDDAPLKLKIPRPPADVVGADLDPHDVGRWERPSSWGFDLYRVELTPNGWRAYPDTASAL